MYIVVVSANMLDFTVLGSHYCLLIGDIEEISALIIVCGRLYCIFMRHLMILYSNCNVAFCFASFLFL